MYYTDNPVADAERYEADRENELQKYPVCCNCGEHIQDEYCYLINDEFLCEECLKNDFRRNTDDFIN